MPHEQPPALPFPGQFRLDWQPRKLLWGLLALLAVFGVFSSVYQVPANSEAVVQRFGAFIKTATPGLQFKLPFGIDHVTIVEVQRQQKLEFGYATQGSSNPFQYSASRSEQEDEKNMVTGDLNLVAIEWVVQYHIADAKKYVFRFREPLKTLRDLSEAVMREMIGDRTVDEALTIGRTEVELNGTTRLSELVTALDMGIRINQVQLRDATVPMAVRDSFQDVNRALQEKEKLINEAQAEYNRAIPMAEGEAEQKITEAEGYATKRTNEAEGDANRFNALLAEFTKAPEVTRKRIFLETMGEVLPLIPGKVIIDEKAPQFLPMMPLRQNTPTAQTPAGQ